MALSNEFDEKDRDHQAKEFRAVQDAVKLAGWVYDFEADKANADAYRIARPRRYCSSGMKTSQRICTSSIRALYRDTDSLAHRRYTDGRYR